MGKFLRALLVAALVFSGGMASANVALGDVSDVEEAENLQEGDNRSSSTQSGRGSSGDAVGGQVTGVVSGGRTSVDSRNLSRDSDVSTGDASGNNSASNFTGLSSTNGGDQLVASDITNSCQQSGGCDNVQEGDNRSNTSQTANATTGDGVAGAVIGVVTAPGGSASVVAANRSVDSSVDTGDADANNDAAAFVGLGSTDGGDLTVTAADIDLTCQRSGGCDNLQEGDNRGNVRQRANSNSGDGVGGQVIGVVSGGATSVDATNSSEGVDVQTGDADSNNDAALFTGLLATDGGNASVTASDITNSCQRSGGCDNVQEGDNRGTLAQTANANSGDGVGGEVIGVVTSAGGSASVVAANRTVDGDVSTGDADANNDAAAFVGLLSTDGGDASVTAVADIDNACFFSGGCDNVQEGDNRLSGSQSATANSGDGVAGQVLGVVSAGAASLDATNLTRDSSADTGDAEANNDASTFVGLAATGGGDLSVSDIDDVCFDSGGCDNVQEGDNNKTFRQNALADSGDAVAGQVSGVVTSAGGSASVVLANTSEGIDASTGDGDFSNNENSFVGHSSTDGGFLFVGAPAAGVLD